MPINESLNLSVLFGGSVKATASTTIVDTSRPAYEYILVPSNPSDTAIAEIDVPTYTITANKTSLNEGDSVVFTLTTTMLDVGTVVPYTISGVSVTDISLNSLTGNFVTDAAGKASLTFDIINDMSTEGNETMTLTLNGKNVSKAVTINDTSGTPVYDIGWYSDAAGNTKITNANEGTSVYLVVKTVFVTNGTNLSVSLSGTGITTNDVSSGSLTGTIVINNNIGYLNLSFVNDFTTEGNETIRGTVSYNGTVIGAANLIINDTSFAKVVTPEITTLDNDWTVVRGFNLSDEFYKIYSRYPNNTDQIVLNIPTNWAFIGSYTVQPGITVDANSNAAASITINNNGIISGIGGEGGGGDYSGVKHGRGYPAQVGGTGIKNTSTVPIVVNNYNLVSGGGGGHGATGVINQADTIHGGTGGIPYGWSNRAGMIGWLPLFLDWGNYPYQTPADYGQRGINGVTSNGYNYVGAAAGLIKEGNVTINNINSGRVLGR